MWRVLHQDLCLKEMNDIRQTAEHAFGKRTYSILAQISIFILYYFSYKAFLSIITIQQSNFMLISP